MGLKDNNKTIQEQEDSKINKLHFLLFLIHFSLVLIMILLLAFGIGSYCCTLIFIILLILNILFYWHRRKINRIRNEKLAWQSRTNLEVINLPKVYDFYCPRCLYQTNEDVENCPNCEIGVLSPTTKNIN
jgi:hypothetical protein